MANLILFTGFYTSQVVSRISSINSIWVWSDGDPICIHLLWLYFFIFSDPVWVVIHGLELMQGTIKILSGVAAIILSNSQFLRSRYCKRNDGMYQSQQLESEPIPYLVSATPYCWRTSISNGVSASKTIGEADPNLAFYAFWLFLWKWQWLRTTTKPPSDQILTFTYFLTHFFGGAQTACRA